MVDMIYHRLKSMIYHRVMWLHIGLYPIARYRLASDRCFKHAATASSMRCFKHAATASRPSSLSRPSKRNLLSPLPFYPFR